MDRELDEIKVAYLEAQEAGATPTVEEVVARYPRYKDELVDFITTAIELECLLDRHAEAPPASTSTRRLREAAVRRAVGGPNFQEAMAETGVSREQVAAAVGVPLSFIIDIERGQLQPDASDPVDPVIPTFLKRLGSVLHRTAEEVLELLQTTLHRPMRQPRVAHHRRKSNGPAPQQSTPKPFGELLAGCPDLTPAQRREWLDRGRDNNAATPRDGRSA